MFNLRFTMYVHFLTTTREVTKIDTHTLVVGFPPKQGNVTVRKKGCISQKQQPKIKRLLWQQNQYWSVSYKGASVA